MSDNPTCPQFPARPPHGGGEPFIAPPAPCRKPGLSVLSVNGRTPDGHGDLALTYIDGAEYNAGYGDPPRPALLFRQGDEVVAVVDATPFLKDGMVSSVEVSGGKLVVTFNTDAGKEPVEVPLTDIFDPASYYDKAAADGRFALKGEMSVAAGTGADADKTTITLMPGVLATVLSAHQPLDAYFNAAEYDSAGRKILLKHGSVVKAQIDATAFIKDGMVSSVAISSGKLVITFNTDAGLEPIEIPLTDIFNPANYYDKAAADAAFVAKVDGKGLSTEDFTAEEKQKLAGIAEGADVTPAPIAPSQFPANPDEEGKAADAYWTGFALSAKAEARSGTQGNIAVYAEYGTLLEDSGHKPSDFATHDDVAVVASNVDTAQATADYAQRSADDAFTKADEALSTANNKADKVANATAGNLAALDENGNLADSGKAIGDFALAKSLAPAFVPNNAYEVGDLCTSFDNDEQHKGTWLYKCILATDGSQPTWPEVDPTHWALATVEDVLAALRTAVANVGTPIAPSQDSADAGKVADAYATGMALSAKAEARGGTQGNIAVYAEYSTLLEDSGYAPSDFASADALNGKANKVANAISGNLAGFDSSGDLTDSGYAPSDFATPADIPSASSTSPSMDGTAAVGVSDDYARADHVHPSDTSKADASALRYAMPAAVALTPSGDAATLVCADRAVTNATIASGFSTLNLTFPAAVSGYVRDFYLRITVAAGESAPAISVPQGVTIENAGGAVPVIADGETDAAATTLVWFSETAPGIFTAKSETVKAVV